MEEKYVFQDQAPYPPVTVCGRNAEYAAAMTDNIGACNSEMSAVSLYFYNSVIVRENFPEVAQCFHGISVVEMHHMDIYARLAFQLGADPRLWHCRNGKMVWWSPECNRYPDCILPLLENARQGELDAIDKYRKQTHWIQDKYVLANLNRIILDEELHVRIFEQLYRKVSGEKQLCR